MNKIKREIFISNGNKFIIIYFIKFNSNIIYIEEINILFKKS